MTKLSRAAVSLKMAEVGFVPVFYHGDFEVAKNVLKACYEGGARVFEFTNRNAFAHEVFGALKKYVNTELPEMLLGVGSVVDAGTTALYLQLDADFVVSPVLLEEMAKTCNRRGVLWSPGCSSLSEMLKATELGAEIVKAFPAGQLGGPAFVKAVKAPCPWLQIMPTGGVAPTEENLQAWFDAGVTCVGMGSKMIPKEIIANKEYSSLSKKVAQVVEIIKKVRKS